jgi:hypothetical protein
MRGVLAKAKLVDPTWAGTTSTKKLNTPQEALPFAHYSKRNVGIIYINT